MGLAEFLQSESFPAFMDRFGAMAFAYIMLDGLIDILNKREGYGLWRPWVRFSIGVIGLVVDFYIVLTR